MRMLLPQPGNGFLMLFPEEAHDSVPVRTGLGPKVKGKIADLVENFGGYNAVIKATNLQLPENIVQEFCKGHEPLLRRQICDKPGIGFLVTEPVQMQIVPAGEDHIYTVFLANGTQIDEPLQKIAAALATADKHLSVVAVLAKGGVEIRRWQAVALQIMGESGAAFQTDAVKAPAWQNAGCSDEEIARLCDIAMCGDHGIGECYGSKLELPKCIAKGDDICALRYSKIKK